MIRIDISEFSLHSGGKSFWKVDCDSLRPSELVIISGKIREMVGPYTRVVAVNSSLGSIVYDLRAHMLSIKQVTPRVHTTLIIDDVYTTGASLISTYEVVEQEYKNAGLEEYEIKAVVLFNRSGNSLPYWAHALFTISQTRRIR